ncbi:MAG: hypothetical protein CVT90_02355 [Candidatus Altiarchaeales archaeon HGW-Altiarchaeales-3]|nr:MAG: hypothetical protein CVT90_02355 [Candidatus Altiarchaeales archaeon HGW-Altiarchaeales-3]
MFEFIKNFIYAHFVDAGYTMVNTITYGLILGISIFGIIRFINFLKIKVDKNFAFALAPFIFFGATTRVLSDAGFFSGYASNMALTPFMFHYWVVSPGIFITMFFIAIGSLVLGLIVERISKDKIKYPIPMFFIGTIFALHNLLFLIRNFKNIDALIIFSLVFTASIIFLFLLIKFIKYLDFLRREWNYLIVGSHLFDAAATYTGVQFFNYSEMHVIPGFLIKNLGAWVMFPLKLVVVIFVIYLIDKYMGEDKNIRRLIKIIILILGLGPGIRDVGRMIIGV